jgi:hypothetical protein
LRKVLLDNLYVVIRQKKISIVIKELLLVGQLNKQLVSNVIKDFQGRIGTWASWLIENGRFSIRSFCLESIRDIVDNNSAVTFG